jgi:hypothetical protein
MLGGDGMDYCTRVPTVRLAWVLWPCSIVPGSKCRSSPRPRRVVKSIRYWKLLDGATGSLSPSRVREGGGSGRQVAKS